MKKNKNLFIQLTIGTLILLCVPLATLYFQWQWHPDAEKPPYLFSLLLITETAGTPFALLTCLVLSAITLYYCKLPLQKSLILLSVMTSVILLSQGIKSAIKQHEKEPRPYVVWLEKSNHISSSEVFYQQPRNQRVALLVEKKPELEQIPSWLLNHWQNETGYSYPSGHSIFVASWALMILVILWQKKAYLMVGIIMIWAIAVESSRLLLGMHWPEDLILSCLIAWILVYIASLCLRKWVFLPKSIFA